MASMSPTNELVRNMLEINFDAFSEEVVNHAKNRIIDVIGCLIAGANAPGCPMILDLIKEWDGKAESTIIVHGIKAPAHNVAMANSIMARSHDYEVPGPVVEETKAFPAHISGTTVPTAFAMAEQKSASGKELLTALILGDDIAARLIAASAQSFQSGWDSTGIANAFGATAIAGKLSELNEQQMLNAFGIVINQLAGTFQCIWDGCHAFKLPQGLAARAGIFSAQLASKGFTGVKDALFSKYGYFALYYSQTGQPDILTKNLGKVFYSDREFKLYPSCRGNHAAIECALALVRQYDIEAENIDDIVLDVSPILLDSFVGKPFEIRDVPQVDALFSPRYSVASVLVRKSIKLEHFGEESIREPKVVDLAQKIKLTGTKPEEKPKAAGLTVKLKGGKEYSANVDFARGDAIDSPMSREEITEKFKANVDFSKTVAREKAEKALHLLENIDGVKNITQIVELLVV